MNDLTIRSAASRKAARTKARMRAMNPTAPACSNCGGERDTAGWYCKGCRASYMRDYRKSSRETAGAGA